MRFYALRLRDVGLIKSSPQKIIAEGTDWRFLNEFKKELKGQWADRRSLISREPPAKLGPLLAAAVN